MTDDTCLTTHPNRGTIARGMVNVEYMHVLIVLLEVVARLVKHGPVREFTFDEFSFGQVEKSFIGAVLAVSNNHACMRA